MRRQIHPAYNWVFLLLASCQGHQRPASPAAAPTTIALYEGWLGAIASAGYASPAAALEAAGKFTIAELTAEVEELGAGPVAVANLGHGDETAAEVLANLGLVMPTSLSVMDLQRVLSAASTATSPSAPQPALALDFQTLGQRTTAPNVVATRYDCERATTVGHQMAGLYGIVGVTCFLSFSRYGHDIYACTGVATALSGISAALLGAGVVCRKGPNFPVSSPPSNPATAYPQDADEANELRH